MTKTISAKGLMETGFDKGFLEDKWVYLKPVPRQGKMVNDKTHSAYFKYDNSYESLCTPKNERGQLASIFSSEEEREFFEEVLGTDLNPLNEVGKEFYKKTRVKFTKTPTSMHLGEKFNLGDPMDNIRVKILKANDIVAPSWDVKFKKPYYKFAIVDIDFEDNKASVELNAKKTIYMHIGAIGESTKKMKEFLEIYLLEIKSSKSVPDDADNTWLQKELLNAVDKDSDVLLRLISDKDLPMKLLIRNALKVGAIQKEGMTKYAIPGIADTFGFLELVSYLKNAKETTEEVYLKIVSQIEQSE